MNNGILPTANNSTSVADEQLHRRLMEYWRQQKDGQAVNRYQQSLDDDFYDGLQWDDADVRVLQERGQAPLVYNLVKQSVDWIVGTEKRNRIDFNVLPRTKEGNKAAQAKKELLKYVSDCNKTTFARSRAFSDAVKVGVGWLEDAIRGDDSKELLQSGYVNWRHIWHDSMSVENDLSDARFLMRSKFVDLDIAIAMFPNHKLKLEQCANSTLSQFGINPNDDDYLYANQNNQHDVGNELGRRIFANGIDMMNLRKRIRLVECWYRDPITVKKIVGGDSHGEVYDAGNAAHAKGVQEQFASLRDTLVMKMRVAILCDSHVLQALDSPYNHNDFPFTPIWGYRRARDNSPYGVIRGLRDPQESLNKRHSKAVHILSTNQIIADEDAATDWDLIATESAKPNGVILLDGRPGARFDQVRDKQLAQQHVDLMQLDAKMIRDVSGVTDANLGMNSRAVSGVAMDSQEEQGSIVTTELFDNLRFAVQIQGEKQLALIEQFYDEEKSIRITGERGALDFMPINQPQFDVQSQTWVTLNPMQAEAASFVVEEQNYQASLRKAAFATMTEMLRTLPPDLSLQLLDLVYENSDFPNRDEMVARIRQLSGQKDPSAEQTPESLQAEQEQQAKQAEQEQQAKQLQQLQLEKLQADIAQVKANTQDKDASKTVKNIEALFSAIKASKEFYGLTDDQVMALAQMSDSISKSAGITDYNGYPIIDSPVAAPAPNLQQNTHPQFPPNPDVGMMAGIDSLTKKGL